LLVIDVDGDVELGQRKSKLITIYDCRVELEWEGVASDGSTVTGKLTIPEVSHEITVDGLSNYSYEWSLRSKSSAESQALYAHVKSHLPPALEAVFATFPTEMVKVHGGDITVSGDPSRAATPLPVAPAGAAPAPAAPEVKKVEKKVKPVNTSKIVVESTFMASAADLFSLLTDENRIPTWTRAPAKSKAEVGGEYSLFGGGVVGKYVSLTSPTEIVQTWALKSPTWPSGHEATLTTSFTQSSDSTKLVYTLAGVPTGQEDELRRNLEGYYIQGFKSIGLGSNL